MYATSVFYSQIYLSLLPGRQFPNLASVYPLPAGLLGALTMLILLYYESEPIDVEIVLFDTFFRLTCPTHFNERRRGNSVCIIIRQTAHLETVIYYPCKMQLQLRQNATTLRPSLSNCQATFTTSSSRPVLGIWKLTRPRVVSCMIPTRSVERLSGRREMPKRLVRSCSRRKAPRSSTN
jgi:hypothetical protein